MEPLPATDAPTPHVSLLGSPEVIGAPRRLSVEAYRRLGEEGLIDERTELIRGMVIGLGDALQPEAFAAPPLPVAELFPPAGSDDA